jgi:protein involved in polysaccharide export with SLBB domain
MPEEKEMTLLEAIALAGGFKEHANMDGTKVIRVVNGERQTMVVKVRDIINKGETNKDIVLQPDDIIAVPEPRQVSVIGEVKNPGKYEMAKEKEMTLIEAIALAGGFTKDADSNRTMIIRVKDGRREVITVPAKDIAEKGQKEKDIVLEPDDVVSVPESFF